jgi:hypothetical protein
MIRRSQVGVVKLGHRHLRQTQTKTSLQTMELVMESQRGEINEDNPACTGWVII